MRKKNDGRQFNEFARMNQEIKRREGRNGRNFGSQPRRMLDIKT